MEALDYELQDEHTVQWMTDNHRRKNVGYEQAKQWIFRKQELPMF